MLLSVFSSLYETFIGVNQDYTEYRDHLFGYVGLFTLLMAAAYCFVFYIILGRWRGVWYTRTHWAITILLVAVTGYIMAYVITKNELGVSDDYVVRFSLFNALFAAVYFILLSFAAKMFSIYSKRTPF